MALGGYGDWFKNTYTDYANEAKKYLDPGGLFQTQSPSDKAAQGFGIAGNINEANFGLPGSQAYNARLNALQQSLMNRQTPGLSGQQITSGYGNYLGMLQNQAAGQGPSAAQVQLQQALSRNLANQQSLQASARPGNQALAARMAAQQSGALGGSLAGQGALARVQEQLGAQQQLGQALQGAQAGYLTGQGQVDQARANVLAQQLQMMQAQQAGGLERERLRNQYYNAATGYSTEGQQKQGMLGSIFGSIFGG